MTSQPKLSDRVRRLVDAVAEDSIDLVVSLADEVEAQATQLADAHAVIRRYEAGWHSTKHVEGLWAKDTLRFEQWEPMTPGEVAAIAAARATEGDSSDE